MKRSSMINVIMTELSPHFDVTDLRKLDVAERILNAILDQGMLPPPASIEVINDGLMYTYYPRGSIVENPDWEINLEESNLWEKE